MPLADVAVSCLVLAHWGDPDAVLENGFADGQWCEECAHVVIIKGWCKGLAQRENPAIADGVFRCALDSDALTKYEKDSSK